jgi:polyhydroxyalkanoate synthesis regulator phasin
LFTGGLNPASMADQLRVEEKRERRAGKKAEDNLAATQHLLAAAQANRQRVLDRRTMLQGDEERLNALAVEEAMIRREIARSERAVILQRSHDGRRKTVGILEAIAQLRRLRDDLERLAPFERDRSEEIAAVRRRAEETQALVVRAEAEARVAEERAGSLGDQAEAAEAAARDAEALIGRLVQLQARLEHAPRPVMVTRVAWSTPTLVVAGAIAISGIAAELITHGLTGVVLLTAGLAAGAIVAVLARKQLPEVNTVERDRFIDGQRVDLAALLNRPIGARDSETLAGDVAGAIAVNRSTIEAAGRTRASADKTRRDRDDANARVAPVRSAASASAAEVSLLFQAIGVANEEELGAKRAELAEMRRKLEETFSKLSPAQLEAGAESEDQLETLLRARLADLDRTIDGPELTGEAARRLESDLDSQRKALDGKLTEQRSLVERLSGAQGELRATLGKLPEDIADLERRVGALETERAASVLAAEADDLAASVFDGIAHDAHITITLLAAEASARITTIIRGLGRAVEIGKLEDLETFAMTDAGGTSRTLEHLSRGTHDALLFAMRLALAEKLAVGVRVLLLDDPFGALDSERIRGLLMLLDDFRKRADFQLIFFTKEPAIVAAVEGVFPAVSVQNLA